MKYVEGDLFDHIPEGKTVIAHVCNDKGAWGSGFVVPLGNKFPLARESYFAWSKGEPVDGSKVFYGSGSESEFVRGEVQLVRVTSDIIVANMVAQTLGGERPLYYNALAKCMDDVLDSLRLGGDWENPEFLCPMFGAARAGGDWEFVTQLIEDCWERPGFDVTICYLPQFLPDGWVASNGGGSARRIGGHTGLTDTSQDIAHPTGAWDENRV